MTGKLILVIGATGKTGSRVIKKLEAKGLHVRRGARRSDTLFDLEDQGDLGADFERRVQSLYVTYFPDLAFPEAIE